ncbi:phosphoribosylformylglycinamidine synthase subunit PurL [Pendulispora albinea]|uniref:Phosphoribosylformylglycinamidine synthase subunit PurL n=1 Tax=Pendulispora albinea TaxID=2741071 RepID=A0ABZ2M1X6_9BACT
MTHHPSRESGEPAAAATSKPSPFPGDLPITDELVRQHKVSESEYRTIVATLGREPSYTELGVFSVMWSEHCSYKSSRVHLRRLPTKGPRVIQGPGENAGVVDIGDGFAAVFKMESHNHPSFIEPYQGAATGVGGILRDVFTMGARPIASLNSLRFGRPDHPRTPELLRGVVAGIGGYGNSFGVPTVGGEVSFDSKYDGNILVNAFTCGVVHKDRIFYGRASGIGNPILYVGAKTGRDGIHGATMASDEFGEGEVTGGGKGSESAKPGEEGIATAASLRSGVRSTMQVGDPFMGKLLLEACLELFQLDLLEGIQDMGAAGLTSSSVEMAGRAKNGIDIDLDRVPRRAKRMAPYEILLSESQERMLLVAKRGCEERVLEICKKWELDAAVIGHVTDTKRWVVRATPGFDPLADAKAAGARVAGESVVVCDIPIDILTDGAPVYDRPRVQAARKGGSEREAPAATRFTSPKAGSWGDELLALCGSPNLGSRRWIWKQYDHIVRGGTAVRPGGDAGVVRVPCELGDRVLYKYLAFSVDCNARQVENDPFVGGAMAVAESCRNVVCAGAEPIGLTDCLNFGNPERPEVMEQFARAIDGIAAACRALEVPVVSGNVSLYNETAGAAILPTPTIACVGLLADEKDVLTPWFKREGDTVIALGVRAGLAKGSDPLGGSEYAAWRTGSRGGAPVLDLELEARLQRLVLTLAREHVLASAHDVADGGLAVALAECCVTAPEGQRDVGARITLPAHDASVSTDGADAVSTAVQFFGETPSLILVSVAQEHVEHVLASARKASVSAEILGQTGGDALLVDAAGATRANLQVPLARLRRAREECLTSIVGE